MAFMPSKGPVDLSIRAGPRIGFEMAEGEMLGSNILSQDFAKLRTITDSREDQGNVFSAAHLDQLS